MLTGAYSDRMGGFTFGIGIGQFPNFCEICKRMNGVLIDANIALNAFTVTLSIVSLVCKEVNVGPPEMQLN